MNLPLSCPDLTAVTVEYVTQRVPTPGQLGLEAGARKFE
jgi:hypothetical protein